MLKLLQRVCSQASYDPRRDLAPRSGWCVHVLSKETREPHGSHQTDEFHRRARHCHEISVSRWKLHDWQSVYCHDYCEIGMRRLVTYSIKAGLDTWGRPNFPINFEAYRTVIVGPPGFVYVRKAAGGDGQLSIQSYMVEREIRWENVWPPGDSEQGGEYRASKSLLKKGMI